MNSKALNKALRNAEEYISRSIECPNKKQCQEYRYKAIQTYKDVVKDIEVTDYLLLDSNPVLPRDIFTQVYFRIGTLYKTIAEEDPQNLMKEFQAALNAFVNILRIDFENIMATKQIVSVYTQLCYLSQHDKKACLQYLTNALSFAPSDPIIHYNLGFVHQNLNNMEQSLMHYKLSNSLLDTSKDSSNQNLQVNNYSGIASVFRLMKQWPQALYYLLEAEKCNGTDPDIQNQLGVVYTEMRRTDLADVAYSKALKHAENSTMSKDLNILKAEILLNHGHMHAYNGDNSNAVEMYNKSLKMHPLRAPFQNKLMNLSYLFDQFEDKSYILEQHKLINKLFNRKNDSSYIFDKAYFSQPKINIGFVSGDFVDHPVSYFISTFLSAFDSSKYTLTCYSECMMDASTWKGVNFKFIRHLPANDVANMIYKDNIHVLFDLSGHTAHNRLDVFALKPSPIQVSYIGYPFSTGLHEMDYRITDGYCDNLQVSQKMYTETLVQLPNCFLCYDPSVNKFVPKLNTQPFVKNGYLTIGCYNRLNKISDSVVQMLNKVLLHRDDVRIVFKTKALLNKKVATDFLNKFDMAVHKRIQILDCTILHEAHLEEYNKVDIAVDTFPYSGTTTSCEALLMGVPVLTLYDAEHYFHAQNVTASLLHNSDLSWYVLNNVEEIHQKIDELYNKDMEHWNGFKQETRDKFLKGFVCNKELYMNDIQTLIENLYNKHKC
jgi:predicted O-linked N-acetylglucosamine transferase (SPINDLY family)